MQWYNVSVEFCLLWLRENIQNNKMFQRSSSWWPWSSQGRNTGHDFEVSYWKLWFLSDTEEALELKVAFKFEIMGHSCKTPISKGAILITSLNYITYWLTLGKQKHPRQAIDVSSSLTFSLLHFYSTVTLNPLADFTIKNLNFQH